jgi:hypothetical protein
MSKETLAARFDRIGQAARESNSRLVEAVLKSENQEGYRVQLSLDAFLELLKSCKPRVLYAFGNTFSARDTLIDELLTESDDDVEEEADMEGTDSEKQLLADPRVKPLLEEFAHYDGQMESFLVTFVVDGVLHSVFEQETWAANFENGVQALEALFDAERNRVLECEFESDRAELRQHAERLCAHPKFNEGRPSREKREYLARSLFKDLDGREISWIVDEATNMQWLNAS